MLLTLWLATAANVRGGPLITHVSTDAARYSPGDRVQIFVALHPPDRSGMPITVEATIYHLGRIVAEVPPQRVGAATDAGGVTTTLTWTAPQPDFTGYQVLVIAKGEEGVELGRATTAVDVSSNWAKFPRYGYLAHFDAGIDAEAVVAALNDFHLNGLQFYDWQWKHHLPYCAADRWRDIANRPIARATVLRFIAAAHARRMMAMNYNLYGGAVDGYTSDGSGATLAMGVFAKSKASGGYTLADQAQYSMPKGWATAALYQMNNRDPAWIRYICTREREVFAHFPFDGWHVDSLGTTTVYDFSGARFNLIDHYPEFLNAATAALGKPVVFNTVNADGEDQIARRANVEFVYSELWEHDPAYIDIARRVSNVRKLTSKALVLAAYPDRGLTSGRFGEPGVRLLDAAIFASGASHIELGDDAQMLHTEYFPDHEVRLSPSLRKAVHADYDFLVAYENILRDDTFDDAARTTLSGIRSSVDAAPGTVWVIGKKNRGHRIVHFVNLLNATRTEWRDNQGRYRAPPVLTRVGVKMYYEGSIGDGKLWVASPDENGGLANAIPFTCGQDRDGAYVTFILPRLEYWTTAWLELDGKQP